MQFHHHGYVSGDPRIAPAADTGIDRPSELPAETDVLIVGSGPAGMLLAAQLAQFPSISTRLVERREGRLAIGQADGIQARSVETFQAFGFAERIIAEAYQISEMNFWAPDPQEPTHIVRTQRTLDDEHGISEFPHLVVNQARVLDYFAEAAARGPARITPDYGWEFIDLTVGEGEYPVTATLQRTTGPDAGSQRTVRAKYAVGCDGAKSKVRKAIGCQHIGAQAQHAWGVMDVLANSTFPDIRTKCAIQSNQGSILLIPREGGYLCRVYVDLGEVPEGDNGQVRTTPLETIIAKANAIFKPYTLEVKDVPWWSVYEVGHRVTDKFDDIPLGADGDPHVFICGDACHTHSAKAGQGMNVSMQDGFNLGWKLAAVLEGRSPAALLKTYSAERQVIAQNLIDFDRQWSSLMAKRPDEVTDPTELGEFYVRTMEFPAGFMTQYQPSMIVGGAEHQGLATGFPIGKRFKSAPVVRVADAVPAHLGHHAKADGRWRIYAFSGREPITADSPLTQWATWLDQDPASPLNLYTPADGDRDAVFDVKLVSQQTHHDFATIDAPAVFRPNVGPFGLTDHELIYAANPAADIFDLRGIDRDQGAVVVVRPDQYVAAVLPLTATEELAAFFAQHLVPARALATI